MDELVIWGDQRSGSSAAATNPTSLITQEDLVSINVATTEDVVKYEPSIVIRRRYIGDANGTLGLRGSNMFQTSRSMVFADGVPLHYFLQSRWNGAPRWTLVSASEIAQVEVIYGPFSAEYSGNAMGGVVLIETAIPQQQEFHADISYFSQHFSAYDFDESIDGYKGFVSYGNKAGDLSFYLSFNRLENESQPQSFYCNGDGSEDLSNATGSIVGNDIYGKPCHYFADSGIEKASTNNYKTKLGYEFGDWSALLNIAYEDRITTRNAPSIYLQNLTGAPIYSGTVTLTDGGSFTVPASRFSVSELNRDSLNLGVRVRGQLLTNVTVEANLNKFSVLRDETRNSARHPADPAYTLNGQIIDYGDTGWHTADVKLRFTEFAADGVALTTGLRYEVYELNLNQYTSNNYLAGSKDSVASRSGGETAITAAFAQLHWIIDPQWDVSVGARYEAWQSRHGYFSTGSGVDLTLSSVPSRAEQQFSPKFSLGYQPRDPWILRYSLAKAYRFPIVEELFSQYQSYNNQINARPDLKPENGLHHNFMVEYGLDVGYLRANFFQETIQNAIESFTDVATSVTTFHSMGEVKTHGIELIANMVGWVAPELDIRLNLTYIDSTIISNPRQPALEGNTLPRMPTWRSNLLLTYHLSARLDVGMNVQYASKSFGRLENDDTESEVFGAQDAYTRWGVKSAVAITDQLRLSVGVDNLTNEVTYVAHPWPGRTAYVAMNIDL